MDKNGKPVDNGEHEAGEGRSGCEAGWFGGMRQDKRDHACPTNPLCVELTACQLLLIWVPGIITLLLIFLVPQINDHAVLGRLFAPGATSFHAVVIDLIVLIIIQTGVAIYVLRTRERREFSAYCEAIKRNATKKSENVMRNEVRPYIALSVSTGLSAVGLVLTSDYLFAHTDVASVSTALLVTGILVLLYWLDIAASYLAVDQRKRNPKWYPLSGLSRLRETARDFKWAKWEPWAEPDTTDQYIRHTLIVFFLAFALALFGALEDFYSLPEGTYDEIISLMCDGEGYIYTFFAFGLFESLLIALIAIEFTTTYFVRDHERASDLVESLLIAGVLDVAAYIALKTILGQPGLELTPDPQRAPIYETTWHMAALVTIAALMSFISSFGAIHYAQLRVDKALKDHLSHLRMLNRLARLAWHDRAITYKERVEELARDDLSLRDDTEEACEARKRIWDKVACENRYRRTIGDILEMEEESSANLEPPYVRPPPDIQ
ncbi:MAG: hypothetical protein ACPGU7_04610 [Gammaproteobacteria bacterium]